MSKDTRTDKTRINKMEHTQTFLRAIRRDLGGKTAGKGAKLYLLFPSLTLPLESSPTLSVEKLSSMKPGP